MKEFIWLFLVVTSNSYTSAAPTDEFLEIIGKVEDLKINDHPFSTAMYIVPSGYPGQWNKKRDKLTDFIDEYNNNFIEFNRHMEEGHTLKQLTFNIYDDNIRNATLALFKLMQDVDDSKQEEFATWLPTKVNKDMVIYAQWLLYLYTKKGKQASQVPPFKQNPMYFTNSETIAKANRLKMNCGKFCSKDASVNQFYKNDDIIFINTNYSGWNLMYNGIDEKINYFREDIGLNSYYFGIHLLNPFWISNDKLEAINPRSAEQYFFDHHQLLTRYRLEKEHLKKENDSTFDRLRFERYDPYLTYKNGLSFPVRYGCNRGMNNKEWAHLVSTQISITECISRGFIVMSDGTKINLTEENHTDLLMKMIRANFENIETAKIVRSLYGANSYPADLYNPAPSILHHPQTSLREPVYWKMIDHVLTYIWNYRNTLPDLSLSEYETDKYNILKADLPTITTNFEYYSYGINEALNDVSEELCKGRHTFASRQRRIKYQPFKFTFTVESTVAKDAIVRLFIGPECDTIEKCFENYSKFFEIDSYELKIRKGNNLIEWSPKKSLRLTNDDEHDLGSKDKHILNTKHDYNIFKFPQNLVIPRGNEEGLKLKLFIIITDADSNKHEIDNKEGLYYTNVINYVDNKPLGFPFHRKVNNYSDTAGNYRFFDIIVNHKKNMNERDVYFTDNLY